MYLFQEFLFVVWYLVQLQNWLLQPDLSRTFSRELTDQSDASM